MNTSIFRELIVGVVKILPYIGLCLADYEYRLPLKKRDKQFIIPFCAIVYTILFMGLSLDIIYLILKMIFAVGQLLRMIPIIGSVCFNLINFCVNMVLNLLSRRFESDILINCLMIILFIALKALLFKRLNSEQAVLTKLYNLTSGKTYWKQGSSAFLHRRFSDIAKIFLVFTWVAILLGSLYFIYEYIDSSNTIFAFTVYPAAGVIILESIYSWLSGPIRQEQENAELPEEEKQEPECQDISQALNHHFSDRIVHRDFQVTLPEKNPKIDWESWIESEDSKKQIIASYFKTLEQVADSENIIVQDYIRVSEMLLNGVSVLIHNPFYRDFTNYLSLPLFHELINNHKVLIITGRSANQEDVVDWIKSSIQMMTNVPSLWNIAPLEDEREVEPDVGIIASTRLYDLLFLKNFSDFFEKVSLVILLEPSYLLATGQMALRNLLQMCESPYKQLTYCIIDRNADGLVDSISHVVRKPITEVIASPYSTANYCRAFWKAEGPGLHSRILPKISHYLGIGMEAGTIALENGARNIQWYSREKMPLVDLKWNIEQYYPVICTQAGINPRQYSLNEVLHFNPCLWQADTFSKAFLVVEDEFCNMFEISRIFSSRLKKKGFINVLSENYLLREYMADNAELFTNDPKAIPSIVPDYSRSERNFVLRTLMRMVVTPVDEEDLSRELNLHGLKTKDPYEKLVSLIEEHTGIHDFRIQTLRTVDNTGGHKYTRFAYSISRSDFNRVFNKALLSAYFVVENEELDMYPMGNTLMGLVEQVLLPGQMFVYEGKSYEVRSITPDSGIIVRRAADHIRGRQYYRQLRTYKVTNIKPFDDVQEVRGVYIQRCFAQIQVETDGYLEMVSRSDIASAYPVSLDQPVKRNLHHKEIVQILLPDSTPEVRYTICLLLNELFVTVYPSQEGYIRAITKDIPEEVLKAPEYRKKLRSLVPDSVIDGEEEIGAIYLIEDAGIDMGLLVSSQRYLIRFLEIICDYLDWNTQEKKETSPVDISTAPEFFHLRIRRMEDLEALLHPALADVDGEDEQTINLPSYGPYLHYGYEQIPLFIQQKETKYYLESRGYLESTLHKSRISPVTMHRSSEELHLCDFCGKQLNPGEFTILKDGRERCPECSKTAVKSKRLFKKIYRDTVREMEEIFQIHFQTKIRVRMVNTKKVNEQEGFIPTPGRDMRSLGYTQQGIGKLHKIYVENGAPLWEMKKTLVHELTHVWQFENWDLESFYQLPFREQRILMEGMAVWTEVQYLLSLNQLERAENYALSRSLSNDEYGVGYNNYTQNYRLASGNKPELSATPFGNHPMLKERNGDSNSNPDSSSGNSSKKEKESNTQKVVKNIRVLGDFDELDKNLDDGCEVNPDQKLPVNQEEIKGN